MLKHIAVCRAAVKEYPVLAKPISGYRVTIVSTLRRARIRNARFQRDGLLRAIEPIHRTAEGR